MYKKFVNHPHSNGTVLECPSYGDYRKDYTLTIGREKSTVPEQDGLYLSTAIDLINIFGKIALDEFEYKLLKTNKDYISLMKYSKCLYPVSLDCDFCEGRFYGENEGKLRRIELILEARWPWSVNKMLIRGSNVDIKRLILKSSWSSQFTETLECSIISTNGQQYNIPDSYRWSLSVIKAVSVIIAGSYLKGFNWISTFEGRIFNSGDDIDELVRKGYVKINGFG